MTNDPILAFEARSEWYGVPARDVREVAQLRTVRPVPRAPGLVAGLAEVHGRIVTFIDLERLLATTAGPAPGAGDRAPFGVVLAPPYDHLGILVRSEPDVAAWPAEPGADGAGAEAGGWLRARLPIGDRLLHLIALPALVERVEDAIRAGFRPAGGADAGGGG
jgi:chemotaxis signal transduction protein